MSQLEKWKGMPAGFPFLMVVLGILLMAAAAVFHAIDVTFFLRLGEELKFLGNLLLNVGAGLQVILWGVALFTRTTSDAK
jgi:hypothetical protein